VGDLVQINTVYTVYENYNVCVPDFSSASFDIAALLARIGIAGTFSMCAHALFVVVEGAVQRFPIVVRPLPLFFFFFLSFEAGTEVSTYI
jgi:hypothetical protein